MTRTERVVTTVAAALAGAAVGFCAETLSIPLQRREVGWRGARRKKGEPADELVQETRSALDCAKGKVAHAVRS